MNRESFEKQQVQKQFGDNAPAYATSKVHAKGKSLNRLIELLQPKTEWRVLDLGTGAGHTGNRFAPLVSSVVATDITFEMLPLARKESARLGLQNVSWTAADAEHIPFRHRSFDLVTCRIAAHHFYDVGAFLRDTARVLRSGGQVAVVDNIVPERQFKANKTKHRNEAAIYINAFEKLRDPSHGNCFSLEKWGQFFYGAGFELTHQEINRKEIDLDDWSARMKVSTSDRIRLEVMLRQAPNEVAEVLSPAFVGSRLKFYLSEAILIGKKM